MFSVPQGHFFMMGDNRDNSGIGDPSVGFVPSKFYGRGEVNIWSWIKNGRGGRYGIGIRRSFQRVFGDIHEY